MKDYTDGILVTLEANNIGICETLHFLWTHMYNSWSDGIQKGKF